MHVLIDKTGLQLLSFVEKKFYRLQFGRLPPIRLLSGRVDKEHFWALVRGYPVLFDYANPALVDSNQVGFLGAEGEILRLIEFSPKTRLPRRVCFPEQGIEISYSGFHNQDGVRYASGIQLSGSEQDSILKMELKQVTFNDELPEKIFEIKVPQGFEIYRPVPSSEDDI